MLTLVCFHAAVQVVDILQLTGLMSQKAGCLLQLLLRAAPLHCDMCLGVLRDGFPYTLRPLLLQHCHTYKTNEAAIKTMYSYTLICFAVESRATGISFSSGTQQQYNLALKSHFVIGSFQVLFLIFLLNQPHHAQFSPTSSLLSCWYCNSELLLFTESQNHQH